MKGNAGQEETNDVTDRHLSEDELVLAYYGELPDTDRAGVTAHLAACAACAAAQHTLAATLDALDASALEPAAGFEDRIWARVQPAIGRRHTARSVIVMGAIAAVLVAVVATASLWLAFYSPDDAHRRAAAARPEGADRNAEPRVLLGALDDHFAQTEILLVELLNARAAEASNWDFQRTTADELVASNRLYRQTARQDGELQLANMLEDLEGVLVEIATAPAAVDREDVDFLRARVEDDALLFKVRAVATSIRDRQEQLFHRQ